MPGFTGFGVLKLFVAEEVAFEADDAERASVEDDYEAGLGFVEVEPQVIRLHPPLKLILILRHIRLLHPNLHQVELLILLPTPHLFDHILRTKFYTPDCIKVFRVF